jgi:hypothetical protein
MKTQSERWLRSPAFCLVFGVLLQGMVAAQEAVPTPPIPDSPSFVRSRLMYAQSTQPNPPAGSPSDGQPLTAPRLSGNASSADVSSASPPPQSPSPSSAPAVPVPDMPPAANSPSDPASNESQGGESQVSGSRVGGSQQTVVHQPVGTAAAEALPITGVAASRPAGAALAPARQRRVRSVLIRVGSLVGAGVAIGTTMALSQGSPSRPPGSH